VTLSIWDHSTKLYSGSTYDDGEGFLSLGFVFAAMSDITITHVSFWKMASDTATSRDVYIWDYEGNYLSMGTSSDEPSGPGWVSVPLFDPLNVPAGGLDSPLVASVQYAQMEYPATSGGLSTGAYSADGKVYALSNPEASTYTGSGNGRFSTSQDFPDNGSFTGNDYWIDIGYAEPYPAWNTTLASDVTFSSYQGVSNARITTGTLSGFDAYAFTDADRMKPTGKYYFEIDLINIDTVTSASGSFEYSLFAITDGGNEIAYVQYFNELNSTFLYDYESDVSRTLTPLVDGDKICFAVDNVNQKWWVRINNGAWGDAVNTTGNPATNTNGSSWVSMGPAGAVKAYTSKGNWDIGLRNNTATYTPPTGFTYLDGANPAYVAPTVAATSSTSYASRTNTTITAPSGITNNDILVATVFAGRITSAGGTVSVTPPSGFTLIDSTAVHDLSGDQFTGTMYVYWKRASSESGNYTFTHATASTQGLMHRVSGCVTSGSPIDVYSKGSATGAGSQTTAAPSIITTSPKDLLIWISHDWEGSTTLSPPTGFTERLDSLLYSADKVQVSLGEVGTVTQTNGNPGLGNPWGVVLLALEPVEPAGSSPIAGTLAVTEASDTVSSAAKIALKGTLSVTEASDTVTSATARGRIATLAVTEASDSVSSTTKIAIKGTFSITEASDTVASLAERGSVATLAVTEGNDTLSGTSVLALKGTLSVSESDDTLSSTGSLSLTGVIGALSVTESNDTLSSLSTVAIVGFLASSTEENDSLTSVSKLLITSSSTMVSEAGDTLAAVAKIALKGSLTVTEVGDTLAGNMWRELRGNLSVGEADDVLSSTGVPGSKATLDIIQEDDILQAFLEPTPGILGYVITLEGDDTMTSTTLMGQFGSANLFEADDTMISLAKISLRADLTVTEDNDTVAFNSKIALKGTFSKVEEGDTVSSRLFKAIRASVNKVEDGDTVSARGLRRPYGNGEANTRRPYEVQTNTSGLPYEVATTTPIDLPYEEE
jgi:hypothetical protein